MAVTVSGFLFSCIYAVLVCTTNSQISLTVSVKITGDWQKFNIYDNARFIECLCKESACSLISYKDSTELSETYKLTQDKNTNSTHATSSYFVCSITKNEYNLDVFTCNLQRSDSLPCNYDSCSISLKLNCSNENVTVVWSSHQEAQIHYVQRYIAVNCCRELTTTVSTLSTTSISTTALTKDTTLQLPTSTAVTRETTFENAIGTNDRGFTETIPFSTQKATERPLSMEQKDGDEDLQFTGAHIGIIIGAVVGGILLAILIMVAIWRFKRRRRNLSKEENLPNGDKQDSHNAGKTRSASTEHFTNDRSELQKRTVAHVSPLTSVNESNTTFNQTPENYTYIDPLMLQTTLLRNENTVSEIPESALTNQTNVAVPESANTDSQSVYTKLGENNVTLQNPYNWLPPENYYSTAAQQASIPSNGPPLKESKQQGIQPASKNAASQSSSKDPAPFTKPRVIIGVDVTRGTYTEVKRTKHKNDFDNDNMATQNQTETNKESDGGQNFQEVKLNINQNEAAILEQTVEPVYGNTIPELESVEKEEPETEKEEPESRVIETPDTTYYNMNE